jgi:hypothetical protein
VVDLHPRRRATDGAVGELPLALPLVPGDDLALHLRGHGGLPLPLLLDERLQRELQDLLVRGAWVPVRLARLGLLQEGEELAADGDVETALGGRERGHGRPSGIGPSLALARLGPSFVVGQIQFNR